MGGVALQSHLPWRLFVFRISCDTELAEPALGLWALSEGHTQQPTLWFLVPGASAKTELEGAPLAHPGSV